MCLTPFNVINLKLNDIFPYWTAGSVNGDLSSGHLQIVDMDVWGWARLLPFIVGDDGWSKFPNVTRLVDEISAKPAAKRALVLKGHEFKTSIDQGTRQHMYKHIAAKQPTERQQRT
jgi:hypothetical protein